jgi:hypothetical protein
MAEKTYTPTDGMASAARRALKWKQEGRRGGTRVGLARANQLKDKEPLSESTVMRMHSFFSRHEVDKKAQGFNQGEDGFPSPGRVAWDLWGGDAGASWSSQKRNQIMNDRMEKSIWSGVFFPANEPTEMALIQEDVEDAPLDTAEVVPTDFEVQREDISEETSVTNEVQETPVLDNVNDVEEKVVELSEVDTEPVQQTEVVEETATPEVPQVEEVVETPVVENVTETE